LATGSLLNDDGTFAYSINNSGQIVESYGGTVLNNGTFA
jgi:uncharacterized membrane protein